MANENYRILDERDLKDLKDKDKEIEDKIDNLPLLEGTYAGSTSDGGPANSARRFEEDKTIRLFNDVIGKATGNGNVVFTGSDANGDKDANYIGWNLKCQLSKTGVKSGEYGNADGKNVEVTLGEKQTSFSIPNFSVDEKGRLTKADETVYSIPAFPEGGMTDLPIIANGTQRDLGWSDGTTMWSTSITDSGDVVDGKPVDLAGKDFNNLTWGDYIRVPNFHVDEYGRIDAGWTAKYKLPNAPEAGETYSAGSGINISDKNKISVQFNDVLSFDFQDALDTQPETENTGKPFGYFGRRITDSEWTEYSYQGTEGAGIVPDDFELNWGDYFRVPNITVHKDGRLSAAWTANYKLPEISLKAIQLVDTSSEKIEKVSYKKSFDGEYDFYVIQGRNAYGYDDIDEDYIQPFCVAIYKGDTTYFPTYFYQKVEFKDVNGTSKTVLVTRLDADPVGLEISATTNSVSIEIVTLKNVTPLPESISSAYKLGIITIDGYKLI